MSCDVTPAEAYIDVLRGLQHVLSLGPGMLRPPRIWPAHQQATGLRFKGASSAVAWVWQGSKVFTSMLVPE